MATEFQQLNKRKGLPYSQGHRAMYDGPIQLLQGGKFNILEVGFGIGYGLREMLNNRIINFYEGCEPDMDSHDFVKGKMGQKDIMLHNCRFSYLYPALNEYDYSFCIEVVEHMEENELHETLEKLWNITRDCVFLSTPDPDKSKEGKWPMTYLINLFNELNFNPVAVRSQWTNLWILNPINK